MWGKSTMLTREPLQQPAKLESRSPSNEYAKLAKKLGITVATEPPVTLEDILYGQNVSIYRMANVRKYMDEKTPTDMGWGWMSCRETDKRRSHGLIHFRDAVHYNGGFLEGVYARPIPYPVLVTMEKIEDAARKEGVEVAFFVSDYAARTPDPFLMVTVPRLKRSQWTEVGGGRLWTANPEPDCFVVERWDEPSFRG